VDLNRSAAKKLGYINAGLTKVKVEVIGKKKP
jgi:rare lipoprotein A (peptidoglycan hydrolase)